MNYKKNYTERLIEVCGSSRPTDVMQTLDISYQAAKNYLNGRLPDSTVLLKIAEKTPYSIHWLLTGRGKKFIGEMPPSGQDTPLTAGQIQVLVREEVLRIFNHGLSGQAMPENKIEQDSENPAGKTEAQPRLVRLPVSQIKREKPAKEKIIQQKDQFNGKNE